jgi:glycine hydroxymethyltransferase
MHVIAGKAVCFGEALKPDFRLYMQNVVENARTLAEELIRAGVRLVSNGTDNHLMLLVVTTLGTSGKIAEAALGAAGITVNKNMIPYDERKPMDPSGIRIGTPALTSRNMGTAEMRKIAAWIVQVLKAPDDAELHNRVRTEIFDLCDQFPVPAAALVDVDGAE